MRHPFSNGRILRADRRSRAAQSQVRADTERPWQGAHRPVESLETRTLLSTYFVSTGGDDGSPGSESAPFRTIQQAANVAQPGDTVLVRGGTYRETVRPARSGNSG